MEEESKLLHRESVRLKDSLLNNPNGVAGEEDYPEDVKFKAFLRGCYSEFFGTFLFLLPILGGLANASQGHWESQFTLMAMAFITGMSAVAMIFCFSGLSGAQFNPAITFALWITQKISNRKCIAFMICQILASILAMGCIYGSFPGVSDETLKFIAVQPPDNATTGNIFFTEFLMTFLLTFVCFAIAFEEAQAAKPSTMSLKAVEDTDTVIMYSSTPQSKSGFAPFAIGFVLIVIVFYGGGSGVGLNPARMLGPAIFANVWDDFFIYLLGQFIGAGAAGLVVTYGPQSSHRHTPSIHNFNIVPKEVTKTLSYIGNTIRDAATGGHHHNTSHSNHSNSHL
jgi:glycerol uptake facilitator-like aquaporin